MKILCLGNPQSLEKLKKLDKTASLARFCSDSEKALDFISDSELAILILFLDKTEGDQNSYIEVLEQFEAQASNVCRILVAEKMDHSIFHRVINKAHVDFIFDADEMNLRESQILEEAFDKHQKASLRVQLLKESTQQFRELEALNSGLEKIVIERTQHIEVSKVEEEEKLNKVRSLIRLIKDLAQISSFEELLKVLRKEFRKFHKVGEPILVHQTQPERIDIISFHSGQVVFSQLKDHFPFSREIQVQDRAVVKALANHFGRPLMKTLSIPLEPHLMRKSSFAGAEASLFVEVSLQGQEYFEFIDFVKERMQPLATTVDRLLLETELMQFSYRWEKTFDGFRDPIAILDIDYELLRANRKFSEKNLKKKCYESFAGRQSPCEGCPVFPAMSSGKPQFGQIRVGEKIYEVHSYPITFDQSSQTTNVVNQYVDITQSRDLYLRLLQSEKLGAIGSLAGNIAHELNNPLTGLRSLSQVLLSQVPENSEIHSDLLEIEKAAGRSQGIIKNLLEFSYGGTQEKKFLNLDDVIEKTMPLLKTAMRIHRQEFNLNARDVYIQGEPHLLQQVVFNLVNNACQAMKDPGVLQVKTSHDRETKEVKMEIIDSGAGIAPELIEKIFEPFFTTKKEGLGTGLGLSLTRKVVESLGGRITVTSKLNNGSQFVVIFPEAVKE